MEGVSHETILKEVRKVNQNVNQLKASVKPILDNKEELVEALEILKALKVGGRGVRWVSMIATSLMAIGGLFLWVRGFFKI